MKEIWKDIKGYEGKYQISNTGKVKSLHYKKSKDLNERILIPRSAKRHGKGYLYVVLSKGNITHTYYIHRLVATYFLKTVDGKNIVNHKDGNTHNNNLVNLEWCTVAENNLHAARVLNRSHAKGFKYDKNKNSKRVAQYYTSEEGYVYHIATYANCRVASEINHLCKRSIQMCCKGDYHNVGGFQWKYVDEI